MPRLRVRAGGAWHDTNRRGAVRVGGATIAFGPPAGFTDEAFAFFSNPSTSYDDATRANLGISFATLAPGSWIGNRILAPQSPSLPITCLGFIKDGIEVARSAEVNSVPDGVMDFLFTTPYAISPGTSYVAVMSANRYVATSGGSASFPYTTTHLYSDVSPAASRWGYGAVGTNPGNTSPALYHVSPIVRFS